MTQVTSSAFKPNAGNGSDVTVRSDDGIVTVTIPSSALKQQANCSLPLYGQLPLYGYKNYNVAYGPYQLVCQQLDNSVVTSFQTPLYASLALPQDAGGKYAALSVAAYDAGSSNWKTISANYNPSSQKPLELPLQFGGIVVMGKQKTVPILLISLGVVTALLVGGYIGLRRFAKLKIAKQIKARQEDYWRKMNGF